MSKNRIVLTLSAFGLVVVSFFLGRQWTSYEQDLRQTDNESANARSVTSSNQKELPATPVDLTQVSRGTVSSKLELTGNFLPRRRTMVVSEVDGIVRAIPRSGRRIEVTVEDREYSEELGLDLGTPVKQGDVLLQLDRTEYELELSAARSRLLKAQKDLEDLLAWKRPEVVRRLKAMREEAKSAVESAQSDFQRIESLLNQRATSQQEFDNVQARLRSARAAVERAEADLAEAEAGPTESQIAVAQALVKQAEADVELREDRLQKTTIKAPYDSVIVERFVEEGERVTSQPRVELMELMDLSMVIVQVGVPERYMGRIKMEDWVQVHAEGSTEPVPGIVILVNEKVDYETRTFRVRVAVENHHRQFKAGQFVKVAFKLDSIENVLVIPKESIVYSGGHPQVFVYDADAGRAVQRRIRTGLRGETTVEVVDGLRERERIVLRDPAILADNMRVSPRDSGTHAAHQANSIHQVATQREAR